MGEGGVSGACPNKVCFGMHTKNRRLQEWPRLIPTRSTFFSAGMRHRQLLQAETYNPGHVRAFIKRDQPPRWAFLRSPHRRQDTCTRIPLTHPRPESRITSLSFSSARR